MVERKETTVPIDMERAMGCLACSARGELVSDNGFVVPCFKCQPFPNSMEALDQHGLVKPGHDITRDMIMRSTANGKQVSTGELVKLIGEAENRIIYPPHNSMTSITEGFHNETTNKVYGWMIAELRELVNGSLGGD